MKRALLLLALIVVGWLVWSRLLAPRTQTVQVVTAENVPATTVELPAQKPRAFPVPLEKFSPPVQTKIKILQEILSSRNDNDPRLDSEFQELTPELKEALVSTYKSLNKESLNDRGTVVFLLGKDIKTDADLSFFQEVLTEAPCLSLSDCSSESKLGAPEDDHHLESQETTLLYPQLMATQLLISEYAQGNAERKEKIQQILSAGARSSSEYLAQEITRISSEAGIKLDP